MMHRRGARSYRATSVLLAVVGLLTSLWPDWLELTTGLDPDAGRGWVEWLIASACALGVVATEAGRRRHLAAASAAANG